MYSRYKMYRKFFSLLLIGASLFLICFWTSAHIRINYTDSMLKGIYYTTDKGLSKGDIVVVCLPDSVAKLGLLRGYLMNGTCSNGSIPVLKRIIASDGDFVEVLEQGIRVNGVDINDSIILTKDSQNRKLISVLGCSFLLGENEIWLFGENSQKSWDSRYYGPIDIHQVTHVMLPIITW